MYPEKASGLLNGTTWMLKVKHISKSFALWDLEEKQIEAYHIYLLALQIAFCSWNGSSSPWKHLRYEFEVTTSDETC